MRTAIVVVLGAIVSGLIAVAAVAAAIHQNLIVEIGPHEDFEMIASGLGEMAVSVGSALAFGIVLATGGARTAVRRTAFVLAALLVVILAAPEVFALVTLNDADFMERDALGPLALLLVGIGAPGLLAIFIQQWIIGRYLFQLPRMGEPSTGQK
jgi:hypothetical protein